MKDIITELWKAIVLIVATLYILYMLLNIIFSWTPVTNEHIILMIWAVAVELNHNIKNK